jgi:RNA polymerase sigma factor (sigma-70 family)
VKLENRFSVTESEKQKLKKDDLVLVEEALNGSQNAFKLLLKKHREAIYHVILKIVHNPQEAEDLVQETFMKAFTSLSSYRSQYKFTTWLYRIAANSSIDYLRKKKIAAFSLDEQIPTTKGTLTLEVADWTYNPEIDLVAKQKRFSIDQAISTLPKRYKEVVILRHKEEKTYEEIASILGIPVGTVKARIFRARVLLKKKLKTLG